MKAVIDRTFHVEEPIEKAWNFLADPKQVVTCVPGASITEEVDEKNYKGEVTMKFGPVKAKYSGEIEIQTLDADNHKMVLKGKGLDSKGKGSADMVMNGILSEKDGGTEVHYVMEISITGMLAQFGSRLITDVSNQVVDTFINNFKAKLAGQEVDNTMNAGSLMGSVVKNIFTGKK